MPADENNSSALSARKTDPKLVRSVQLGLVVLYGTFGLLMFGPLAFGAVEAWSMFILESGSVLLLLLWLFKQSIDGEINIRWNPLFVPMIAFGALILLQLALRMTAYRHDTILLAMLYGAYGILCFLASQSVVRTSQARKVAVLLSVYGAALAAFALLQGVSSNGRLYWLRQPRLGGWIYGPYVNHNHYAGLMELLVPIPLVISLSRHTPEKNRIAAGVAAAIMVSTIFISGSRGGMIAVSAEMIVFAVILIRQKTAVRVAIAFGTFAVVLLALLIWLGGSELTSRVSTISSEAKTEISGGVRLSIDRDGLRMFRSKPILGWGLGTFPVVYPQFRSFYTNFFVNEAHNDYLQLLDEMGILGFAVMIWFVVVVYRRAVAKIPSWTTSVTGALSLACMLGATGILIHSFLDFNLQIPANAALFYVLCTLASAPPLLHRAKKREPSPRSEEQLLPASEVV